ncbi:hypothetical protein JNW88_18850 [Micromonospora sp. ATA32]|nr:hypothetical protein [Micromonospora sp. ATA32]
MQTVTDLIEAEEAAGTASTADVAQAEREAAQAAEQVTTLERRVVDGDEDVTPDEIEKAKSLRGFAKLRAQAIRGKAERTAHAAWLRRCDELRAEIEAYPGTSDKLAKLLAATEKAIVAFVAAVDERNQLIEGWRQRMQDLQVRHSTPLVPPASQGHIGLTDGGQVIAGRRRLEPVNFDQWIVSMLDRIRVAPAGGHPRPLRLDSHPGTGTREALYERLAQMDAAPAEPDPNLRFFRNKASGQVITLDAHALTATNAAGDNQYQRSIARGELVEISRKEAWGQ